MHSISTASVCYLQESLRQRQDNGESSAEKRYQMRVANRATGSPVVQVYDGLRDCLLFEWRGAVVRHLIESKVLPNGTARHRHYACDKSFIWHLILAAAATKIVLDQMDLLDVVPSTYPLQRTYPRPYPPQVVLANGANRQSRFESLAQRLKRLERCLVAPHQQIARLLFAYPGNHFSGEEVSCLMLLECPSLEGQRINAQLDDLARWQVIQRIEVDADNVFYDIDTRPHLHLFDAGSRQLSDAPVHGIMRMGQKTPDGRHRIGR